MSQLQLSKKRNDLLNCDPNSQNQQICDSELQIDFSFKSISNVLLSKEEEKFFQGIFDWLEQNKINSTDPEEKRLRYEQSQKSKVFNEYYQYRKWGSQDSRPSRDSISTTAEENSKALEEFNLKQKDKAPSISVIEQDSDENTDSEKPQSSNCSSSSEEYCLSGSNATANSTTVNPNNNSSSVLCFRNSNLLKRRSMKIRSLMILPDDEKNQECESPLRRQFQKKMALKRNTLVLVPTGALSAAISSQEMNEKQETDSLNNKQDFSSGEKERDCEDMPSSLPKIFLNKCVSEQLQSPLKRKKFSENQLQLQHYHKDQLQFKENQQLQVNIIKTNSQNTKIVSSKESQQLQIKETLSAKELQQQ